MNDLFLSLHGLAIKKHASSAEVACPTSALDVPANSTAARFESTKDLTSSAVETTSIVSGGLQRIKSLPSALCTMVSGSHTSAMLGADRAGGARVGNGGGGDGGGRCAGAADAGARSGGAESGRVSL